MRQIKATVISNDGLLELPGARYFLMRLEAPDIAQECKPGQYVMVQCADGLILRRPVSIHYSNGQAEIELLFSVPHYKLNAKSSPPESGGASVAGQGIGMLWLSYQKKGTQIAIVGPLGNGFDIYANASNLLLIAGGIGIAPLKFLAARAIKINKHVTMLIGAQTKEGLYPTGLLPVGADYAYTVEFDSVSKEKNIKYQSGRVTSLISDYIEWTDQAFAVGPAEMYCDHNINHLAEYKPVQVSLEVRMGCGVGACYACSIRTKKGMVRVCKEGPVFNIKDIIWQEVKI